MTRTMSPVKTRTIVRRLSHTPITAHGAPYRKVKSCCERVLGRRVLGPWRQREALDRLAMVFDEWDNRLARGEWVAWPPPSKASQARQDCS